MVDRSPFHDEVSLAETAASYGKKAMYLGLIPGFVVRYFPDSCQFYIPDENRGEPLTPERAYMHLKRLLEQSGNQATKNLSVD